MNMLLLIFDDFVPQVREYADPVTPHMDRLAARGVTFDNAFTPCAICAPGRACVFSGLRPDTHGVTTLGKKLRSKRPDLITWPQALRSRGWHTMRSGKVYHKGVPECNAGGDGDDDPFSWCEKINPTGLDLNCDGLRANYTPRETHVVGSGGAIQWLRAEKGDGIHHDYKAASDVIRAIRQRPRDDHCLWAAGFIRPHVPLVAPERFFALYDGVDIRIPGAHPDATPLPEVVRERWCSGFGLTDEQRAEAIRAYLACISFADDQIGRILDALDEEGLADDTVVLLTGDHGFQLGEHGLWFKNYLYRESVSIPLIVADPRRPETHGAVSPSLVEQADIFPTLCELLDVTVDQQGEGTSMVPILDNPRTRIRSGVLHQVDWGAVQGRSLRTPDFHYAEWQTDAGCMPQLFDLRADPREAVDLLHGGAAHPAATHLAETLHAGWKELLREGDPAEA